MTILKSKINFNYVLKDSVLPDYETFRGWDIIVDKITFNSHIEAIVRLL